MERLLRAISSGLTIQECNLQQDVTYYPVSDKVREQFERQLGNHLTICCFDSKVGDILRYEFNTVDSINPMFDDISDNLAEVFDALPTLSEGQHYCLPNGTFINFKVVATCAEYVDMDVYASDWIAKILDEEL